MTRLLSGGAKILGGKHIKDALKCVKNTTVKRIKMRTAHKFFKASAWPRPKHWTAIRALHSVRKICCYDWLHAFCFNPALWWDVIFKNRYLHIPNTQSKPQKRGSWIILTLTLCHPGTVLWKANHFLLHSHTSAAYKAPPCAPPRTQLWWKGNEKGPVAFVRGSKNRS